MDGLDEIVEITVIVRSTVCGSVRCTAVKHHTDKDLRRYTRMGIWACFGINRFDSNYYIYSVKIIR